MAGGAIEQAEAVVAGLSGQGQEIDPLYAAATAEYIMLRRAQIESAQALLGGPIEGGMGAKRTAELDACQLYLQGGRALANATEALRPRQPE